MDIVLEAAKYVTAVLTIGSAIVGALKAARWVSKQVHAIHADIATLKAYSKDNYMSTLRLTIMSEEMPIEERLKAGDKYIANGGNGAVKTRYKLLQNNYKELHKEE